MNVFGMGSRGLTAAEKSLDFVSRSTLISSSNIANAETPGYKSKELNFHNVMKKALEADKFGFTSPGAMTRTNPGHLPIPDLNKLQPEISLTNEGETINGNNVNMDSEMSKLSENSIKFGTYSTIVSKELEKMKLAIEF